MRIQQVDLADRRQVRRFVEFPFWLYRDSPLWVPPLLPQAEAKLDPSRHPFYEHSQAAFFVALDGTAEDEVAGRIAVLDDRRHNAHHGAHTAFFYLFDTVDEQAVTDALFGAAADWARARGLDRIWGPKGFSALDGQGILIEGFEHRPAMGIPYNYPYYSALLEEAGFEKALDLNSFYMARGQFTFPERYLELTEKVKKRRGLRSVSFQTKDELRALIPRVREIYNNSFVEVQGFVPHTQAEFEALGEQILSAADPSLISFLMKGDDIAGFVIGYPDLSAAIQHCRGRIWPTGWFHLRREFKRTRWINFNGAAILPEQRGLGGNALLYVELYNILDSHPQYDYADLVQVQETNARMMNEVRAMGVMPYKTHRVYQRLLA